MGWIVSGKHTDRETERHQTDAIHSSLKAAFHDTDTDILVRIVARMSVSWNAALTNRSA